MIQNYQSFIPDKGSVSKFHSLMLSVVGPRPIAFVSTINEDGVPNLAPFSFFNVFGSNPATLIFSPARRGRDGTTKHTLQNVDVVKQCVVNVVSFDMVEQMSLASTEFDEGVNEFVKAGFTELPSQFVKPPRVAESPASFECEVVEIVKTGEYGGAGNLVICRILALHIKDNLFHEDGTVSQEDIDLVGRMGYEFYCRANGSALFELPKPKSKLVLGFDGLPKDLRESKFLTGNELARLAGCMEIPDEQTVSTFRNTLKIGAFDQNFWLQKGRNYLINNDIVNAFNCFLLAYKVN